jgi:protein O-GlcNAc transferase
LAAKEVLVDVRVALRNAFELHQAGRTEQAVPLYRSILRAEPEHFDALHLLGVAEYQQGDHAVAIDLLTQATRVNPRSAPALNNLGNALRAIGRNHEALACYRRALELRPDYVDALYNAGNTLRDLDRDAEAVALYDQALAFDPNFASAYVNRGNALHAIGRTDEALSSYQRALALNPGDADALNGSGNVLRSLNRQDDALQAYRRAVERDPGQVEALTNIGNVLREKGRRAEALDSYRRALAIDSEHMTARWKYVMALLPTVADASDDVPAIRAEFVRELSALDDWMAGRPGGHKVVGDAPPFYIAYQEWDNRGLLARYGAMCARAMGEWYSTQRLDVKSSAAAGRRLRVGIVSAHVRDSSVWNAIVKGWIKHLDRDAFDIHLFYLGSHSDAETESARSSGAAFAGGLTSLTQWVTAILEREIDVMVYPEIGMDPMTAKLAALRLAPVQVAGWGHPETSGLPTIDYYVSAAAFEPPDAQSYYTETLILAPLIGCCYERLPVADDPVDLAALGIAADRPVLVCPGMPFKYAPQYDRVFAEIARRVGPCQLVFFTSQQRDLSEKLHQRLTSAFTDVGLRFEDIAAFIPWQPRASFFALMRSATAFLDTIGFSGFNTAMQAIECGLPIVTREGRFMRGRFASGILRTMNLDDMISGDEPAYIERAVRLATDAAYRADAQRRIAAAREVLFDDVEAVRFFGDFLLRAGRGEPVAKQGSS